MPRYTCPLPCSFEMGLYLCYYRNISPRKAVIAIHALEVVHEPRPPEAQKERTRLHKLQYGYRGHAPLCTERFGCLLRYISPSTILCINYGGSQARKSRQQPKYNIQVEAFTDWNTGENQSLKLPVTCGWSRCAEKFQYSSATGVAT